MLVSQIDMRNNLLRGLKRQKKYGWVKTGERIGYWGILPNYDPIHTQKNLCKLRVSIR